jgi:tetratricopeptide (TPR) repeat protein
VRLALRPEFERVFDIELVRAELDVAAQFEGAWQRLPAELHGTVRELLLRLVQVGESADDAPRARSWRRADAEAHYAREVAAAREAGLVRSEPGTDGAGRLALADPAYVANRPLAAWIEEERPLLAWRQRLRTYLDDWVRNAHEPGGLLQGAVLDEAERHAAAGVRLLDDERAFIAHSRLAADAAAAAAAAAQRPPKITMAETRFDGGNGPAADPPPPRHIRRGGTVAAVMAGVVALLIALAWLWQQQRAPQSAPSNAVAVDTQIIDGKRLADAGSLAAAIEKFDAALQLNPQSIDALLARADARVKSGANAGAMTDLDRAVELAPTLAAARLARARLRADTDPAGALADLAALEKAGGTLDLGGWTLRARLLSDAGQLEPALQAYGRMVELGNVSDGQIGRAQALERLGRPDDAAAAYRAALETTSDPRLRTLAQARLQVLQPNAGPAKGVAASAYLHLSARADELLVPALGQALEKAGLELPRNKTGYAWELVNPGSTRGEVRYFYPEDKEIAERARAAVQQALAAQGIDRTLTAQPVDGKKLGLTTQRGRVEVWMPAIANLRGLRFDIFVCRAGEPASAVAEQARAIITRLGATATLKPIDDAARNAQFGLPPAGYEIRYSQTIFSEQLVARVLLAEADFAALASWRLVAAKAPTPGYMSLFVCPAAGK